MVRCSPDHRSGLRSSLGPSGPASTYRGAWHALYTVKRDGSELKRLVKAPTSIRLSSSAWAPNGKAIAYTQVRFNSRPQVRIFRDGRITTFVPLGGDATWSRHGLIAYGIPSGFTTVSRVCLKRAATGDTVRCFGEPGVVTASPVWAPDGSRLMLGRGPESGPPELWVVRPDGTIVSRTVTGPASGAVPIFSPDGGWLAFTRYAGYGDPRLTYSDLHIARPDGANNRRIVSNGTADAPDWQPRPER